jgi:hypothetical protein
MELTTAIHALKDCESRLQEILAKAAAAGDYEAVVQLTDWARAIRIMQSDPTLLSLDLSGGKQKGTCSPNTSSNGRSFVTTKIGKIRNRNRSRVSRRSKRAQYPKFSRYKDELIKIGWSKKEKGEYQHKAPRKVVDALLSRVDQIGASGEVFTTDDLFPLRGHDHSYVPSYQAYLVLAWVKSLGLLSQHGRQGYTLNVGALKPAVDKEWANLPKS